MSFSSDEYLALRKKRMKEEEEKKSKKKSSQKTTKTTTKKTYATTADMDSFEKDYLSLRKERMAEKDIAPVKTRVTNSAPVRAEVDDKGFDFFQKGTFKDGYQFGDVTKAILGTAGDVGAGVVKGAAKMVGGVIDAGAYGVAGAADLVGADGFADKLRVKAKENQVDNYFERIDSYLDQHSLLGKTSDAIAEGLGQVGTVILTGGLAGAAGLGAVGASAVTAGAMGVSSMGAGMSEAYEAGATDEEARTYGLIKGVVDAGSEMIFGGLGKTVKALGLSRGLSSLDDMFAQKLASKITNHVAKNFVEFGVKASAEGVEEVLAGIGTAAGKHLTYMHDEELLDLIENEDLLEQFVVGAVTSGIAQSGIVPGMKSGSLVESNKKGRDFISGMSQNEKKVIDKVVEDRIAEEEKNGKLTEKEKNKIYEDVVSDMERGYIDIDTIEEVLGGDTYKAYKDTVDREDALAKEYKELGDLERPTLAQTTRYNELHEQMKTKDDTKRNQLKSKLSEEVFGLAKGDRLVESYNERARKGQAFNADLSKYDEKQKATIQKAVDSGILNNTRRTHEFVDMIAKITADKGVPFDFTNNAKLKDSGFAVEGKTVNGYVTKDGVTLNIDSAKSLNSVTGHEITHVLEGTELYDALQKTVIEYAKTKGDYQSRYDSLAKLYEGIEDADVNAELTADLVGDYLFTDSDFINKLSTNRNVFQKIYDEIKYLCKVATAGSKEARELEKVKRAFEKAYKAESKGVDGTKHSVSESPAEQEAIKRFGTTTDFAEAGYILPSGKMLRFTDDAHKGQREYDHRAIGMAYGVDVDLSENHGFNFESNKFLNEFVENGGIRFDAGEPDLNMDVGLQLSSTVPLTREQEQIIRDLVEWKRNREEMFESQASEEDLFLYDGSLAIRIDFGGDGEYAVGSASAKDLAAWGKKSLEYKGGNINADRIIADIRHYYRTGETRQQSTVAQFRYSISDSEQMESNLNALRQERSELEDQLDMAYFNDLSDAEVRKLNNRLTKVNADIDKIVAEERRASVLTPMQTILDNLGNYRRSDLESLAEQISDSAWDGYEGLSRSELEDALREAIQERELSPLEMQSKKFGLHVRPVEKVKYSISDSDYQDAVNRGDDLTVQRMVNEVAKESGVIMNDNGRRPLSLYRGTPNFGRTVFKSPVIFTSTSPSVSGGYGGNKGYARKRLISESYTPDDGSTETLIKNARNVLGWNLQPFDDAYRSEIHENMRSLSDELSEKVNDVWTNEAIDSLPDVDENTDNSIAYVLSLAGDINSNIDDFGDFVPVSELEYWLDKFDEHLPKFREYLNQHRNELKDTAAWPMFKLVMGYDLSDFAIDARYKFLQSLGGYDGDILVTETGNLVRAETVREQVESVKDVGSYHLYGYAGDNPLVIDGKGAMWHGVPVEQWGGHFTTDEIVARAQKEGYTSVCIKDINDVAMNNYSANVKSDIYAFFDREQVKSADPITYDDNGNVIPLSERFNTGNLDIRYSMSNEGEQTAPVGNYNVFGKDIALAPISETETTTPVDDAYETDRIESLTDADAPPEREDVSPDRPIKTVEDRHKAKVTAVQTELSNNQRLREESRSDFDQEIARLRAEYDAKKNKNTKAAQDILRRIERMTRLRDSVDADYAKRISDLEGRVTKMNSKEFKTAEQRKTKQQEYASQMESLVGDTSTWVDKKLGISYRVNTLRRNLRDIVRDASGKRDVARADAIYNELQGKYNTHEAMLNREANRIKGAYAEQKITKAEDAYIQMLGEFRHNPDTTLTEDVVKDFYEKNKDNIDEAKVDKIIEDARKTYDELLVRVNEVLREQGMKEIPYRKGYFPHFTEEKQGFLAKLFNWKTQNNDIPTDIAGLTEQFNPNRSWQSFNKQRKGDTTDYSFTKGLDTYVQGSLDWIYHIEDIQKRRAFENHIRYIHSEKGVQEKIDAIRSNDEYDADEAQEQIDLVLKEAGNPLNNFVTDLRAGTNTLANKKSSLDRGVEEMTNRKFYSTMTNISNRVSANMVGGSVSSALTNFIPITQSWGEVSPISSLRAMGDTIRSTFRDDGVVDKSDFLTNRLRKNENLYKTTWDKISDKVGLLMEGVDNFTSQTVWRSKYLENISKGMSENEAIKNADQFAENVIAGRSRGNMPTIFDSKNPLIKTLTAFQLEVSNQYGYMFKDMPQEMKDESIGKLVKGYASIFLGAYAYNALYSSLVGRDAAFDPISIIEELLGDIDDEDEDAGMNLLENVLDEVPFVGGLMGGGRIPIASAIPYDGNFMDVAEGVSKLAEGDYSDLTSEWMKPVYYLALPVGGGQIKKTVQGLKMFSDDHPIAGSYTDSGKLRFTVEDNLANRVKAGIFGQYASKNARQYFDEGRSPLSEKQIQELVDIDAPIQDYWAYRDGLKEQETIEDKFEYINDLDLPVSKKNILINNVVDRKERVDLTDYDKFSGYEEFDFYSKNEEKYNFLKENGVSYTEYKSSEDVKEQYDDIYSWYKNNPEKVTVAKAVTGNMVEYRGYTSALNDIRADKNSSGKSISGSAKRKKIDYINSLDLDYGARLILFKSEYKADDSYNTEIIEYLNGRDDISYDDMVTILKELDMKVDSNGNVTW